MALAGGPLGDDDIVTESQISRRMLMAGSAGAAVAAGLARWLPAGAQATPDADGSSVADGVFPVTITHVYGETTFDAAPERIITLSWINQDAAIALGTIPVGMPFNAWGGDENGFFPWTLEAIGDRPLPTLYDATDGLPFEQFIELAPDAIIGTFSGITQDEYDTLSKIAPTVAYPEIAFGTSWQDVTRTVGAILGKAAAAEALVEETSAKVVEAGAAYPQLQGKTFAFGNISNGLMNVYTVIDTRVQLLSLLGLTPSPFVESLPLDTDATYYVEISAERFNEIDADILILWFATQEEADAAAEMPTMQGIPAVKNGAYVAIVGETNVMAVSAPSPLAIPYIIDAYVPQLGAAADNVPTA